MSFQMIYHRGIWGKLFDILEVASLVTESSINTHNPVTAFLVSAVTNVTKCNDFMSDL